MKKILYFIVILFAAIAAVFGLVSCGNNDDESLSWMGYSEADLPICIPYVNDFAYDYYTPNGEKIEDKSTAFNPEGRVRVNIGFTISADALAAGKSRFTLKFKPTTGFEGRIISANSSSTDDSDFTAMFTTDNKPKSCEIQAEILFGYSSGQLKFQYRYDDEEYISVAMETLNNDKTLKFSYDDATDGYILEKDSGNRWLYNANATEIVVPAEYNGKPITGIGDEVFTECKSATSVTLPFSLKTIGKRAFASCSALQSVRIPDFVTSIGDEAFSECYALKEVIMSEGIKNIGDNVFASCNNLTYALYDNGSYLGSAENKYLYLAKATLGDATGVTVHESCKIIGCNAFYECRIKLTKVILPDGLKVIGDGAFSYCSALADMTIPDSVTEFGNQAFYGCEKLYAEDAAGYYVGTKSNKYTVLVSWKEAKNVRVNDGCLVIDQGVFKSKNEIETSVIESVVLPSVTHIGNSAFENCKHLTSVDMPSVTSIGKYAFRNCESLESVTIPDGVTSVDEYAFNGCSKLKSVVLPESLTSIGEGVFSTCFHLTSATLPSALAKIPDKMFRMCSRLESVNLTDSLRIIGENAFEGCSLTSVNLPATVEEIGKEAFYTCFELSSITLPSSLNRFGYRALYSVDEINFSGTRRAWRDILIYSDKVPDSGVLKGGMVIAHCVDGDLQFKFIGIIYGL